MARKAKWPPQARPHKNGQDRVKWAGREYYVGRTGSPEAAAGYAALLGRLDAGRALPPPPAFAPPSVDDAILLWAEQVKPTLSPGQQWRYARTLTVLSRTCGGVPAAEFGAGHLRQVRSAMLDGSWLLPEERGRTGLAVKGGPREGGPWSRRTANKMTNAIRTVWRWLDLEPGSPVPEGRWAALKALPPLDGGKTRRREWRDEDFLAVADAMTRSPARRMLLVQLWSGCRAGEARGMLWEEIDRAGPVWVWRPARHKNAWRGHERVIALGPKAQAVLADQRAREPRSSLVFPCRLRGRGRITGGYTASAYAYTVRKAAARAGRAGLQPYDARHCARMRVSRLLGLEAARSVLGHATAEMTAEYGQAVDLDLAAKAALAAG